MKRKVRFLAILLAGASFSASAQETNDYSNGIIIINEDWYGHQNSTVNFLRPDETGGENWYYRIIQTENPGMELGCTNQYGAIWGDRLYLIAKQEKDPGAVVTGGRITVANAKTMKILHQQTQIDPSGKQCDGRGFLGVDEHKGYISTSNGIWVFDLDTYTVTGQVEGSKNPNAGGDNDRPNDDPTGALYHGQSGMMVSAAGRVFAAHQQYGLLVIDPAQDKVIDTISLEFVKENACIGSVVKAKDGSLWLSVTRNTQGTGAALDYLVRVDPATLETSVVKCPDGMYGPANSWYAWTPDAFVASQYDNKLYFKGGKNSWFSGTKIYCYDIDSGQQTLFTDLEADGENWKIYGCSLGVDPKNGEVYMSLYHEFTTPEYVTRRYSPTGEKICDYSMIRNYWFPSNMIFVDSQNSGVGSSEISENTLSLSNRVLRVGTATAVPVCIYTPDGILVEKYNAVPGFNRFDVTLPAGMYIVRAGGMSLKTLVD